LQSPAGDHLVGFVHDLNAKVCDEAMQIDVLEKEFEVLGDGLRNSPWRPSL